MAVHIMRSGRKWAVRSSGTTRARKRLDTVEAARAFAQKVRKPGETVYEFGEDGRIVKRWERGA